MLLTVEVPAGLAAGDPFSVEAGGQIFEICVPDGVGSGELIEVDLPIDEPSEARGAEPLLVDIAVPDGTGPGSEVTIEAEGVTFTVVVPDGLFPGDIFTVEVPQPETPAGESKTEPGSGPTGKPRGRVSDGPYPYHSGGTFDMQQAVEVYRTDGRWSAATVVAYDALGDTYDVELFDGQVKYMMETDYLRFIDVGGFHLHQRIQVLEGKGAAQEWLWARVDGMHKAPGSMFGSYSVEFIDGQKRQYTWEEWSTCTRQPRQRRKKRDDDDD